MDVKVSGGRGIRAQSEQVYSWRTDFSLSCFKGSQARQYLSEGDGFYLGTMNKCMRKWETNFFYFNKEREASSNKLTEAKGKDWRKMRREPGRGGEVNGEAKQANNRDRRKFCTAGDRNAKEEKQELSLGIAGNKPIAQEVAQTGP